MRRTKIPTPRYYLRCHEVQFYCQDDKKVSNVQIEYEIEDTQQGQRHDGDPVKLRVFSLWADGSNNVIKAHLIADRGRDRLQDAFFRIVRLGGESQCPLGRTLTADSQGFLRYGCRSKSISHLPGNSSNDYIDRWCYDSKAAAMKAILDELTRYRTLGGLNLANLGSVSDRILEQFGYEKLPDLMRRGNPMWMGNPEWITKAGTTGYYVNSKDQEKNIAEFLEILQVELGGPTLPAKVA